MPGLDDGWAAVPGRYCTGPCLGGMTAVRQSLGAAGVTDAEWVQMSSDPQDSDIADYLSRVQERARSESPSIWLAREQHSLAANFTKWDTVGVSFTALQQALRVSLYAIHAS